MSNKNSQPKEVTLREITYVEGLLQNKTKTQAAKDAGYSESVAQKSCWNWIGRTRKASKKPHLYDYYQERLKEHLRLFDVTKDSVLRELKIIAFSKITSFVDLPTRADMEAAARKNAALLEALGVRADKLAENASNEPGAENDPESEEEEQNPVNLWNHYRLGTSIKLKAADDIPEELIPAIAEINETREGIRVKLHSKLDALEKLSRYLKLYEEDDPGGDGPKTDTINIVINGTKSPLLERVAKDQAEKPAEKIS